MGDTRLHYDHYCPMLHICNEFKHMCSSCQLIDYKKVVRTIRSSNFTIRMVRTFPTWRPFQNGSGQGSGDSSEKVRIITSKLITSDAWNCVNMFFMFIGITYLNCGHIAPLLFAVHVLHGDCCPYATVGSNGDVPRCCISATSWAFVQ